MVPQGRIHLAEVVKLFDASTLAHLKQEFGGLQSLLRNHHQIFQGIVIELMCIRHQLVKYKLMHFRYRKFETVPMLFFETLF